MISAGLTGMSMQWVSQSSQLWRLRLRRTPSILTSYDLRPAKSNNRRHIYKDAMNFKVPSSNCSGFILFIHACVVTWAPSCLHILLPQTCDICRLWVVCWPRIASSVEHSRGSTTLSRRFSRILIAAGGKPQEMSLTDDSPDDGRQTTG